MWKLFDRSLVDDRAPDISGEFWLNATALPEAARRRVAEEKPLRFGHELAGKVVLVDFWDYSCINCVRTLPYLKQWWRRYQDKDFLILGVHTPEFEFGKIAENVKDAALRFALDYPVVSDPDYVTWKRYHNNVWPRELIVDSQGVIQYDHRGEGAYQEKEAKIQELISQLHPQAQFGEPVKPVRETDAPGAVCLPTTPEIYLGFKRGQSAHSGGLKAEAAAHYQVPSDVSLHSWALQGQWRVMPEEAIHGQQSRPGQDFLVLHYLATEVFAVMRSLDGSPLTVFITQDDQPLTEENQGEDVEIVDDRSRMVVKEDRLYQLVKNPRHGEFTLKLAVESDQLALHTFTFGTSCQ